MNKKICTKCHKEKNFDCFSLNKAKKSGYSFECKDCHKIIRKKYYEANKKKEIDRVHARRVKLIQEFKDFKSSLKCKICQENHISTLHFHHLDPKQK